MCDEACLLAAIKFAVVDSVGLAAITYRKDVLCVAIPEALDAARVTADGFTDLRDSQAVIRMLRDTVNA